jgi:O-antigen/teichoic acid export membrane protein
MSRIGEMDFGSEVVKTVGARVFLATFGFVGTIVFARVLGPTSFGGYYLLYTVVQLADRPFRGWTAGVEKRYSEHKAPHDEMLGAAMLFNLAGLILLTPLAFLLESHLVSFTGLSGPALLLVLLLGSLVFFYPVEQLVAAEGKVAIANYVDGLRSVLTLGLQLVLVAIGLGAAGMAYGLAGATAIAVGVNLYILGRIPSWPTIGSLRSVASFARYSIPTSIIGKTYSRLDSLLLGLILTPAIAGQYEVALKLTIPAVFISNSIQQAMFPKVSNLHSRGEEIASDIANSKAFTSILAVPLFFGALALSQRIVATVYGADYRGAGVLLIGLALYRVLNTQTQIHVRTLEAIDRPRAVFRASTIALAVNLPLGYALVVTYGAVGVVIATIVAECIRYTLVVLSTRPVVGVGFVSGELLRQFAAGTVMFAAVTVIRPLVTTWSWLVLLSVVGFGAAVYFTVLVVFSHRLRVTARGILSDLFAAENV